MHTASKKSEYGFTLIELLIVILVIGVLAAIAVMGFMSQRQKANDASVESDVKNLSKQLETALIADPNAYALLAADEQQDSFKGTVGSTSVESALSDGVVIAKVEKVRMDANGELVPLASGDTTPIGNGYAITAYHVNGSAHGDATPLRYDSITGKFSRGIISSPGGGGGGFPAPELLERTPDQLLRLYVRASAMSFGLYANVENLTTQEFLEATEVVEVTELEGLLTWILDVDWYDDYGYMMVFFLEPMPPGMSLSLEEDANGQYSIVGYYTDGQGQYTPSSPLVYSFADSSSNNDTLESSHDLFVESFLDGFARYHTKESLDELTEGDIEKFNEEAATDPSNPEGLRVTLSLVGENYYFSAYHINGVNYTASNPYVVAIR